VNLTAEQLQVLRNKNVANIARKLQAGGRLTAREERLLQEANAGTTAEDDSNFYNLGDLARALGLSRRGLNKARKRFPDFPEPRDDGRYEYVAALAWKNVHEIKPDPDDADEDEDTEFSKSYWDRRRARLEYERGIFAFEVDKQRHLPIEEVTTALGQMLAGFRTALNMLPSSAARWVLGLRDFNSIKAKLQDEVDAVLQTLGRCDYLEEYPEFEKLCQAIGRHALGDLLQRTLPDDTN
jgi:hypothetical protein